MRRPDGRGSDGRGSEGRGSDGPTGTADNDARFRAEIEKRETRIRELESLVERMAKRLDDLERALSKAR